MSRVLGAAFVAVLFIPIAASAHQKSVSYSTWTLGNAGATVQIKVSWFDLTSLPALTENAKGAFDADAVVSYLQQNLRLSSATGPCEPIDRSAQVLPADRGWMRVEWRVHCEGAPLSLESDLFPGLANHVHLARIAGTEKPENKLLAYANWFLKGHGNEPEPI